MRPSWRTPREGWAPATARRPWARAAAGSAAPARQVGPGARQVLAGYQETDATRAHGQARWLRGLRNSPPCSPDCQRPPRRCPAVQSDQLPSICRGLDAVESQGSSSDGRDTSETNASRWPVSRSSGSGPGAELRQVIRQRPAPGRRDGDGELKPRDMVLTQPDFAWSHIPVSY